MSTEFGKLNFAVGFNRTSAFPLDANSYFEDLAAAKEAVKGACEVGSSDSAYYFGQLIIVKTATGVSLYQIKNDGTLKEFGEASSAEDVAKRVEVLESENALVFIKGGTDEAPTYTLKVATAESDGFMSREQAAKLAGIETTYATKAEVTTLTGTVEGKQDKLVAGTAITIGVDGKTIGVDSTKFDAAGKAQELVSAHNTDAAAHSDIREEITAIKGDLDGRTKAYVFQNKEDETYKAAIAKTKSFKLGDTIYFIDENIPDEWVTNVSKTEPYYTFAPIESKTQIEGYVKDTRTINGHDLKADVTLTAADVGADAAGTAQGLIETLNVEKVAVGAGETIKSISEANGKIAVEKQAIVVEQSAVTGLDTALAGKVNVEEGKGLIDTALVTKLEKIQYNAVIKTVGAGLAISEAKELAVDAETLPAIATSKVTGLDAKLTDLANLKTQVGADTDEASVDGTIYSRIKQLQTDVANAGKIDVVKVNGTPLEVVDKAVDITIPAALITSVGDEFTVTEGKLDVKKVNVNKLEQTDGDTLILDGGTAA